MRKILLAAFFILLATLVQAQSDAIWNKVRERYRKVNTVQGSFRQAVCSDSLGICQEFIGWFYLKRPDKIRLEVTYPDSQIIVVSGNKVWFRLGAVAEVSEQELPSRLSPFDIFSDTLALTVTETRLEDNLQLLRLVSEDTISLISDLTIWINPKDFTIKKFSYLQGPGTVATFELYRVKFNNRIADKIFDISDRKK